MATSRAATNTFTAIVSIAVTALLVFILPMTAQAATGADPRAAESTSPASEPIADGTISGVVTHSTGEPAHGQVPKIYRLSADETLELVGVVAESLDDGAYVVSELPPGDYYALAPADDPRSEPEGRPSEAATWYGGATMPSSASVIHVDAGQSVAGIDIARIPAATITGRVTTIDGPLEDAFVTAGVAVVSRIDIAWGHQNLFTYARTDATGSYTLTLAPLVDYGFSFGASRNSVIPESWDDVPQGLGLPTNHLNLAPGEVKHGIDAELDKPAAIFGTVRDADGNLIADAEINLYPLQIRGPAPILGTIRTGVDGAFEITYLEPGTYALAIMGPHPLRREFWKDQPDFASATPIVLGSGERFDLEAELNPIPSTPSAMPTISGSAVVGSKLSVTTDGWPIGTKFSHQWLADGAELIGSTAETLTLHAGMAGKSISVRTTGFLSGHLASARTSAETARVMQWAKPTIGGLVDGTAWVDRTLTAVPGAWSPSTVFTYQWYADGSAVPGATSSSWKVPSTIAGKSLSVMVTGSQAGYDSFSAMSATTPNVAIGSTPQISGTAYAGAKLTAVPGPWTPGTTLTYHWRANGFGIPGATTSTFTIPSALVGQSISVAVVGSAAGYPTTVRSSAATPKVALAPVPRITGTPYVGAKLTASPGTWTAGTTFTYQWYANGVAIAGATGSTYVLTSAERDKTITLKVTGAVSGHATVARTSAATLRVALTAVPTITGTRAVGYTLTAVRGTWTTSTTFTYQWYANGTAISGATASTLRLTSAQRGKPITVRVTGAKTGYPTVTRTAATTAVIR
ncbi:hypothetical protein [Agromyces sp. NPDC058104]|uniref:hypothetical protein n=1 Tax=Agromyces sp. NPDC058104 TaxID=3346342 RepID=UPI0036D806F4